MLNQFSKTQQLFGEGGMERLYGARVADFGYQPGSPGDVPGVEAAGRPKIEGGLLQGASFGEAVRDLTGVGSGKQ